MKIDSKYFSFIIVKSELSEKTSLSFIQGVSKVTPPHIKQLHLLYFLIKD